MSENGLHRIPVMRTALEQIQELHPTHLEDWGILGRMKACRTCHTAYPCKTRKLADAALDRMARTNQGDK
ncbi:hypothetical protein [Glutamicibacter ardleyensis]|uniref:Uncharacterized protein n=1 Tax=Glutamicibacter ardleyensis TaxID=225894 RepID=A0ABQ2DID2_9MICC|nr:hypothetical protein [Glutamicibacter ardleyensis]GGJ59130.1 hypothetical protein GCM10007173_17350 [Glutamicibacter ardleyensis]